MSRTEDLGIPEDLGRTADSGRMEDSGIPFPVLFARLRGRISSLCSFYGNGLLSADFRALALHAQLVRTCASGVLYRKVERLSSRTGQTHSIGGFTGFMKYEGNLTEFIPWLDAAQWTGVGRHTVWGNGAIETSFA